MCRRPPPAVFVVRGREFRPRCAASLKEENEDSNVCFPELNEQKYVHFHFVACRCIFWLVVSAHGVFGYTAIEIFYASSDQKNFALGFGPAYSDFIDRFPLAFLQPPVHLRY
jgi:hypothetical protein